MNQEEPSPRRKRPALPLHDDDMALAYGETGNSFNNDLPFSESAPAFSYIKLFITIVLAAPAATLLALLVMDNYPGAAGKPDKIEINTPPAPSPAPVVQVPAPSADNGEQLAKLLTAFEKSNDKLAANMEKQAKAIEKLADRKPDIIKVQPAAGSSTGSAKAPQVKVSGPKVIVVKVPSRERFDLEYEKRKILELIQVDLDDPITSSAPFDKIKSRDVLKELIRSFNAIIAAARDHDEVSDFVRDNALTGKRHAAIRLQRLK